MNFKMKAALQELLTLYMINSTMKTFGKPYAEVQDEIFRRMGRWWGITDETEQQATLNFANSMVQDFLSSCTDTDGKALTFFQLYTSTAENMDLAAEYIGAATGKPGDLTVVQMSATDRAVKSVLSSIDLAIGANQGYRMVSPDSLLVLSDQSGYANWRRDMAKVFYDFDTFICEKEYPGITAIQVMDPSIQMGGENSAAASVFLNHLPPTMLAGATPHFKLTVLDPASPLLEDDKTPAKNFSLFSSLYQEGDDSKFSSTLLTAQLGEPGEELTTQIGMEAFTAPQTLVNWKDENAIDPGRPLLSIQSFKVDVQPSRGAMSTQTAEVIMTLHDRGRMPAIQRLVRPDNLGKIEILVEWGWTHNQRYETAYGALIDAMKVSQKFMVYQSSFSLQEGGAVQLTLKMVTKGSSATNWTDAAMSGNLKLGWTAVKEAMAAVQAVKGQALAQLPESADVSGTQEISTLSLSSTGQLIDAEAARNIRNFIRKYKNKTGDLAELAGHLDTLATKVREATETLETQLEMKLKCIRRLKFKQDPYVVGHDTGLQGAMGKLYFLLNSSSDAPWVRSDAINSRNVCSFGTICYHFLAMPLAMSGDYDDVQMVFYSANKNAGWAAGMNMGMLPIDMRDVNGTKFEDLLKAEYKKYGGQYPVTKLIAWITNNFIENQYSLCYGLQADQSSWREGNQNFKISDGKIVPRDPGSDPGKVMQANQEILKLAYYGDKNVDLPAPFKPINVRLVLEVLEGESVDVFVRGRAGNFTDNPVDLGIYKTGKTHDGETYERHLYKYEDKARTILRIHVLDEGATSQNMIGEVLRKFKSTSTGLINVDEIDRKYAYPALEQNLYEPLIAKNSSAMAAAFKAMIDLGLLKEETLQVPPYMPLGTKDGTQALLDQEKAKPEGDQDSGLIAHLEARLVEFSTGKAPPTYYKLNASPKSISAWYRSQMPYILYGTEGTAVKQISAATTGDSKTASMYMVRAAKNSQADGAVDRGLPMRVMPISMTATLVGCPLIQFMQEYFVDMGTNSTLDNRYRVVGVSHDIKPGEYTTTVKFVPGEAYAEFRSSLNDLAELRKNITDMTTPAAPSTP